MKKQMVTIFAALTMAFCGDATHFVFKDRTDKFVPVYIQNTVIPTLDGTALAAGDEIGIFNKSGLCAGAIKWDANGQAVEIAAWSDDSQTKMVDGLVNGDTLYFKFYDASANKEFFAQGVTETGSIVYNANDIAYVLKSLTALTPVAITTEPVALSKNRKESAEFTVVATGGGTLTYQWQKDGKDLLKANGSTFAMTSVSQGDAGSYRCIVSNATSADSSVAATLTVTNQKPTVTKANIATTSEDVAITLDLSMTDGADADSDPLALLIGKGTDCTVSGMAITPKKDFFGTLTVPVRVTDGIDTTAVVNMIITVSSVNDAPVLVLPMKDSTIKLDRLDSIAIPAGMFSDVDDNSLVISVTGVPTGMLFANGMIKGTPTAIGTFDVEISATDDSGVVVRDTMKLKVEKPVAIVKHKGFANADQFIAYPSPVVPSDNMVRFTVPAAGFAELKIYDQLGALLDFQTLDVIKTDHLEWDLCNKGGVKVGSGTYVAILKLAAPNGEVQMFKTMIGVQR